MISTSHFVHYSKNPVIFKTFCLLKMDWILVIAIVYSMVGVSLAGFVCANKGRFPLPEFTGRVDGPRTRVHFLTPVNSGRELG